MNGGGRKDVFVGGAGGDRFIAKDGVRDVLHGNGGNDRARFDHGKDVLEGIETRSFTGNC
jgi:Ca2+-binding RTX toxin-like protein